MFGLKKILILALDKKPLKRTMCDCKMLPWVHLIGCQICQVVPTKSTEKVLRKYWERTEKVLRKYWKITDKVWRKYEESTEKVLPKYWESTEKELRKSSGSPQKGLRKTNMISLSFPSRRKISDWSFKLSLITFTNSLFLDSLLLKR